MNTAFRGYEFAERMVREGNPNSISDAGAGTLALHACIEGAWLNVRINASELKGNPEVEEILKEGAGLVTRSLLHKDRILKMVNSAVDS